MRSDKINEKGMTLVEILAALVILGIVFVGFMTIFPQMTNFNEKTEAKLETMNLARKELANIKAGSIPTGFLEELKKTKNKALIWTEKKYLKGNYTVELNYYTSPDLKPENFQVGDGQKTLYKVRINVFKENQKISETFGYIELDPQ